MKIDQAIEKAEEGFIIFRPFWRGINFVVYRKGYPDGVPCDEETAKAWRMNPGDLFKCNPYFQCEDMDGMHYAWKPNHDDLGADDWECCISREKVYHT